MGINSKDARIVLVRPRNPLNIAAAARAMRNFGWEDLAVVAAYEPVGQDARAAPGAEELLRNARVVPRLLDAIEDCTLVLGTSSLTRRQPAQPVFSLSQLGSLVKKRKAATRLAILFGSEKTGLTNKDLSYCHAVLRIPTEVNCPTMNLGQAVAVCCYELQRAGKPERVSLKKLAPPATVGEVTRLIAEIETMLAEKTERARSVHLRQMLLRWPLTSQDVTLLLGVLRDLSWRLRQKP
ncbi:MAG: hypothetical protein A3H28_14450 [Acidobacteria bacterium RIFCSPLOWO2_02_FULL_61_28]|nr:MAG: hypothetical protein A3H28_14450 [Acidobacteria bacterium RIFCSPLOWO2_02_FULL_61_28]